MFDHVTFDVEIRRDIDRTKLAWPARGEAGPAGEDSGFGCNRSYCDLRGFSWSAVEAVLLTESEFVRRLQAAVDLEEEMEAIDEERLSDDGDPLCGLDVGVAAATCAISAARCVPFTSCNAGAFGGHHHEAYPLVAFYLRPQLVSIFQSVAEAVGAGLWQHQNGAVSVYGRTILVLMDFAERMHARRREFAAVRLRVKT